MVVTVVWPQKLGAIAIGFAFIGVGIGIIRLGAPLMSSLNKMYQHVPGKFQYPPWWHKLFGGLIVGFGVLVAVVGGALAGR